MKLLIVYQYFLSQTQGGVSRFNRLTQLFARRGAGCTIICSRYTQHGEPAGSDEAPPGPASGGIHIKRISSLRGKRGNIFSRLASYCSFGIHSFLAALRERDADAILLSSPPLSLAGTAILLKHVLHRPLVLDLRDLWPENAIDLGLLRSRPLIWLSRRLEKRAYRAADLIAVVTPAYRDYLLKAGVAEEKIRYFPNSPDKLLVTLTQEPAQIRNDLGIPGKFVIGYFGNHGYAAKLTQILDVARLLKDDPDFFFLFAGSGFDRENLIRSAEEQGLTNVLFLPNCSLPEACELIRSCDVCIASLLRAESMKLVYPSKIFEYMSFAKPILHTVDGICRELIDQAGCGFYCEPERPEQLAKKIRWLRAHPDEAKRLGQNGCEYADRHFNSERIAADYLEAIEELAESSAKRRKQ